MSAIARRGIRSAWLIAALLLAVLMANTWATSQSAPLPAPGAANQFAPVNSVGGAPAHVEPKEAPPVKVEVDPAIAQDPSVTGAILRPGLFLEYSDRRCSDVPGCAEPDVVRP